MANPILTKTFTAGGAVNPYRIMKRGTANGEAIQATGSTAPLLGVSRNIAAVAAGAPVEIDRMGIAEVEYGGSVAVGDPLTSDSVGRAVVATLNPATPPYIIGFADFAGAVGDIRNVLINQCIGPELQDANVMNVTISSAELLALNATPKTLIAAPGAGLAIVPTLIQAFYDYNTVAYAGIAAGEDLAFRYSDGNGAILATMETTGFLDQASDQFRAQLPVTTTLTPVANAPLVAHMLTGEITTGNGPVKLRIEYKIITLAVPGV